MTLRRFVRFNLAGLAGIVVQLATLWCLTTIFPAHYQLATMTAVAATIAHNFAWHWRWTWADRSLSRRSAARAFVRFSLTNGAVSLLVNLMAMPLLVTGAGLPAIPANLVAIAASGIVNFRVADAVAFQR